MASFLDTTVLVYAVDAPDPRKRAAAPAILEDEAQHLVVSAQVLGELYWTVTRKLRPARQADEAHAMVRELTGATDVVAVDASPVEDAIALARRTPVALRDADIMVAAERGGLPRVAHGRLDRRSGGREGVGPRPMAGVVTLAVPTHEAVREPGGQCGSACAWS